MKSKIRFDLNASNESVITAEIVYTDDVRDKVARTFYEGLGYESNLAYLNIQPDFQIPGLLNIGGKETDTMFAGRRIEIKTFRGEETDMLCQQLCSAQLEALLKAIPKELKRRKSLPQVKS